MNNPETASDFEHDDLETELGGDPNRPLICPHVFKNGNVCGAQSLAFDDLCYKHSPTTAAERKANAIAAGHASAEARAKGDERRFLGMADIAVNTTDAAQLQVLIDAMLRIELEGQLPAARGRQVVRLLALAVRNLPRIDRKEAHPVTYSDDPTHYLDALEGLRGRLNTEITRGHLADQHRDAIEAINETDRRERRPRRILGPLSRLP